MNEKKYSNKLGLMVLLTLVLAVIAEYQHNTVFLPSISSKNHYQSSSEDDSVEAIWSKLKHASDLVQCDTGDDTIFSYSNDNEMHNDMIRNSRIISSSGFAEVTKKSLSTSNDNNNNNNNNSSPRFYKKTGTTIVGCLANNGQSVILAADTRATERTTVADKFCEKIHDLSEYTKCCGAGTSGDIDHILRLTKYSFMLRTSIDETIGSINKSDCISATATKRTSGDNVISLCKFLSEQLFQSGGNLSANLILGGYDFVQKRAILCAIHPHGSVDLDVPFAALGSGGLAAMGVLERRFMNLAVEEKTNSVAISEEEAIKICINAIQAGIQNDLGSGSHVDICVINQNGTQYQRGVIPEETLPEQPQSKSKSESIISSQDEKQSEISVNGFGNFPFSLRSPTVIKQNEDLKVSESHQWYQNILR